MKKTMYVLCLSLLVFIACSKDEQNLEEQTINETESVTTSRGGQSKIMVCHFAKSDDIWEVLEVNSKSLDNHLKHGDVVLVDADGDGYVTEANECLPVDCDDTDASITSLQFGSWCATINDSNCNNCEYSIEVSFDCETAVVTYYDDSGWGCGATWSLTSVSGNVYVFEERVDDTISCLDYCAITIVDNGSTKRYSFNCPGGSTGAGDLTPCEL